MVLLCVVGNAVIIALRVVFFTIFIKCFKNIFFILYLSILILPLNTFSLLKCTSLIIIILLYKGI